MNQPTPAETVRCAATTMSGGYKPRTVRCQKEAGHEGKCGYFRTGGQGGSWTLWWGANARPIEDIEDMNHAQVRAEIWRLRQLCDEHNIDWRAGIQGL